MSVCVHVERGGYARCHTNYCWLSHSNISFQLNCQAQFWGEKTGQRSVSIIIPAESLQGLPITAQFLLGFHTGESGGGKSTTTLPHSHSAARVSPPWYNVNSTRLGSRAHLLFLFQLCDVILVCVVSVRPRSNVMNFSTHVMHMGVRPYITVSWCYDAWNQFPIKRNMLQLISYQWNYMLYKISMKL